MPYTEELEALQEAFRNNGILCKWNEPMSPHTSFKIGGKASLAVWPTGRAQLVLVLSLWRDLGDGCPICVLGNGSNVLLPDRGYHGLMVITTKARRVVYEEDEIEDHAAFRHTHIHCQIYAECGASLTALAYACGSPERGLSGLEFAYGIPGTVGGAVVMNAGAYGSEMEQCVIAAEYYDLSSGHTVRLVDTDMQFAYRYSIFQDHPEWVVISAVLKLSYGNAADIYAKMEANMASRTAKQPLEYPSAGSVFKRPVDNFAGRMVENVGMKGYSVGGAQVSDKHAGFIVNRGGATSADVVELVHLVQDAVEKVYRVRLECEIRLISDGLDPNDASQW